ncbi:MAG: GumC family protein [Pyrinomonadaceae bacterium]
MERDERLLPLPNISDIQKVDSNDMGSSYPSTYEGEFSDNRSIQEYLHVIYKRLPLILALTILTTAVTAFYMYRKPSVYSATSSMIIEPPQPKLTNVTIVNNGVDYKYYNTQLQLLQSPDLMYDVVVDTGLYRDSNLLVNQGNKGIFETVKTMFAGEATPNTKINSLPVANAEESNGGENALVLNGKDKARAQQYAGMIGGGIAVTQVDQTNLVNITVQNTNPALAATVANGIADVFIKQDVERETRRSKDIYNDLTKSIEELKASLSEQENQLINLMGNYDFSLIGDNGSELINGRLNALSGSWLTAMDDRRKAEANYQTAARSKNPGDLPSETFNTQSVQDARKQYVEERAKLREDLRSIDQKINEEQAHLKELLVRYTDEYVEVQKSRAKIAELRSSRDELARDSNSKIDTESSSNEKRAQTNMLSGLNAALTAARAREEKAREAYLTEVSKANVQGKAARELTTLKDEITTKRTLYNNYIQKQKEQELAIAGSLPDNIKVSSRAVPPTSPIGPDRNRNIILAFLVSLIGGIGLSFLLDYLDDSIRTSDDIGRQLGLPTLALIPYQETVSKKQLGDGSALHAPGEPVHSLALIALNDTRSPVAEAYRHLRTSLLFSSAGNPPHTILVTSSQPSEGKTTTAINTAIALAQSGADVVIVDCDLRRPRLHIHFSMSNSHGLTNYLSGDRNNEKLLKPVPELPNLKVLSSGPIPPNPAELLSSNEMKNLLHYLKGSFKHVIIDSPPAISFTDAAILSTQVDGVVLVAKAGASSIHLMRRFKQRLAGLGVRIYGVVLNGVKPNSLEYGYYGYDYAYDYYANSDETTPLLEDEGDYDDFPDDDIESTRG